MKKALIVLTVIVFVICFLAPTEVSARGFRLEDVPVFAFGAWFSFITHETGHQVSVDPYGRQEWHGNPLNPYKLHGIFYTNGVNTYAISVSGFFFQGFWSNQMLSCLHCETRWKRNFSRGFVYWNIFNNFSYVIGSKQNPQNGIGDFSNFRNTKDRRIAEGIILVHTLWLLHRAVNNKGYSDSFTVGIVERDKKPVPVMFFRRRF